MASLREGSIGVFWIHRSVVVMKSLNDFDDGIPCVVICDGIRILDE